MTRYETLLLTIPEITEDESSKLESQIVQTISKAQGSLISAERWGKYRLAYPVNKQEYGIYFLVRFEVDEKSKQEVLEGLTSLFTLKYNNLIMRYMTSALEEGRSLEYQKPEAVDAIPTRDVDTFLRENKMEGLLSSSGGLDEDAGIDIN